MKLNLGCSDQLLPGYVNVDICAPADMISDLRRPWPWPDNVAEEVRAYDIIEHLPDKIHTMNELWRVTAPGGVVNIEVPTTDGPGAWQDPTHVSYWNMNSFQYYRDRDPHRVRFGRAYGIKARFAILHAETRTYGDGVIKLTIALEAVK